MVHSEVSDSERFIEAMRQISDDDLRLVVQRVGAGGWEIEMSSVHKGKRLVGRGVGETFSEAWDNVTPNWA